MEGYSDRMLIMRSRAIVRCLDDSCRLQLLAYCLTSGPITFGAGPVAR